MTRHTSVTDGLQSINAYYKMAMMMPVDRLQNIVRGRDNAIPATIAMMALEAKMPQVTAAKGQQAAQQPPQPSVREQLGNQINTLPENVGVGALPAPNMEQMDAEGMAEGGIVAFGHGGDVPGYADGILVGQGIGNQPMIPAPRNDFNSLVKKQELAQQGDPVIFPAANEAFLTNEIARLEAALKTTPPGAQRTLLENNLAKLRKEAAAKPAAPAQAAPAPAQTQTQASPAPAEAAPPAPAPTQADVRRVDNALDAKPAPAPAATRRSTRGRQGVGSTNAQTDAQTKTDNKSGITTLQPSGTSTPDLKSIIKDVDEASGANKIITEQAGIDGLIDKQNKDELARYKERPKYEPYKKYEESLKSDEEKVKSKKNENFQLALINAGLAIAGGSSRYALQNIGQGALVGTKQYAEGIKDLEAAAKERQKAFAMIEEARNAKAEKDFDRYDSLMNKQSERMIASKQHGIEALTKTLQITVPQATSIWNNLKTNASHEAIAREQNQVQRENIQMHREGNQLQYQVGMANAAANAGYKDAMIDQNKIQKNLLAQQRGEAAYKDYLATPEGQLMSTGAIKDSAKAKYLRDLREWYMRDAHTSAGLSYTPGGQPSAADQSGFKVLGPKP